MHVYTAHVRTESSDHYIWVFSSCPTRKQVIARLMEYEGADPTDKEDYNWYSDTTAITIEPQEVVDL